MLSSFVNEELIMQRLEVRQQGVRRDFLPFVEQAFKRTKEVI